MLFRSTEEAHKQCMDGAGSEYPTVMERFRCFLDRTAGDLLGKDAVRKRRTGNLVRLVFVWMVERQKLEPERALPLVWRQASRTRKDPAKAPALKQMLAGAAYPQLLKFSQVAVHYEEARDKAVRERDSLFSDLVQARKRQEQIGRASCRERV